MKYFKQILVLFLSIWLPSCETDVDVSDLLDQQQLVVINGYLSPQDTVLKVQVSKSRSKATVGTINNEDLLIKDAEVFIANEQGQEIKLTYTNESLSYEAPANSLVILPSKEYFLTVMAQGKEYKASCLIPSEKVSGIEGNVKMRQDDDFFGNYLLKVTIDDIKDKKNFYVLGAVLTESFENFDDTIDDSESNVNFEFEQFVTDNNRENVTVSADGAVYLLGNAISTKLKIMVANTEQILYEALRAEFLNKYNSEDPLTEPVIAPTNIEGENGFGVFAGYQLTEKEITL